MYLHLEGLRPALVGPRQEVPARRLRKVPVDHQVLHRLETRREVLQIVRARRPPAVHQAVRVYLLLEAQAESLVRRQVPPQVGLRAHHRQEVLRCHLVAVLPFLRVEAQADHLVPRLPRLLRPTLPNR